MLLGQQDIFFVVAPQLANWDNLTVKLSGVAVSNPLNTSMKLIHKLLFFCFLIEDAQGVFHFMVIILTAIIVRFVSYFADHNDYSN